MVDNKEKIYIYTVIVIISIIVLGVIIIIWTPNDKNKKLVNTLNNTNNESYEEIQNDNYSDLLKYMLQIKNYDSLFEKVDTEWLNENNFDKESLYSWLFENLIISNDEPNIIKIDNIDANDNFYYRVTIQDINNKLKYIVINETLPNKYTISFEQDTIKKYNGKTYTFDDNGTTYKVTVLNTLENLIQYQIDVVNNSSDYMYYDFNYNDSISIKLNSGENIYATDITSYAVNEYEIVSGGSFSIKAVFTLSLQKQNEIESIVFNNASDKIGRKKVEIILKEDEI